MTVSTMFWRSKKLSELTESEWEALCDGCGKCCLKKTKSTQTQKLAWTDVACRLFDSATCRCSQYRERHELVPECGKLTVDAVTSNAAQLPPTCAYRLVALGVDLPSWHYLICGDKDAVHRAGVSARLRTVSENDWPDYTLEQRCVEWPIRVGNDTTS